MASVLLLAAHACGGGVVEYASAPDASVDAAVLPPIPGFSWIVEGELAGMPQPGQTRSLDEDLSFLQQQGIDLLVSLTEDPLDPAALSERDLDSLHIPIPDFTAPSMEQMAEFAEAVEARTAAGEAVGVHCGAGFGRTGTMVAAYFVWQGMAAKSAIARIRDLRPGSIETEAQEQAIFDFEAWLG
jgi:atypical dual specificity phosphatase